MLVLAESRLTSDFEVIRTIGQGGFGRVFKVKLPNSLSVEISYDRWNQVQNKLDSCSYAVKQIFLKSASKHVNKKITREVKLLSKLNHQNIVR